MAETFLDIRQSQTRVLQDQLNAASFIPMDSTLASINSELTTPGRLIAQFIPSLTVIVGAGTVVNPNTSKNRVLPFIDNIPTHFTGGTITFPSTTGNITVSAGPSVPITIGANQFVAVLVQLDSSENIQLVVGAPASSLGTVVIPTGSSAFLAIGYIIVQSNGSSVIQNITNAMLYQFSSVASLNLTGVLPFNQGGTGQSSPWNADGVIYAASTTALASTLVGSAGQVLFSNGPGLAPSFQTLSMNSITNALINGAFDFAQRGTTSTTNGSSTSGTTGTWVSGANTVSVNTTTGINVGSIIASGTATPFGNTVVNISGSTVTMLNKFTSSGTAQPITFSDISDYVLDRWYTTVHMGTNSSGGVVTTSQIPGTLSGSKYAAQIQITTSFNQIASVYLSQALENFNSLPFYGQNGSFSVNLKALGNVNSIAIQFFSNTAENKLIDPIGSPVLVAVNSSSFTLGTIANQAMGTAWTTSGVVGIRISIAGVSSGQIFNLNNGFIVEQAMMNVGSPATFSRCGASIQEELALCQRYYEKTYNQSDAPGTVNGVGNSVTATFGDGVGNHIFGARFAVSKRVAPSSYNVNTYNQGGTINVIDYFDSAASGAATVGTMLPGETAFQATAGLYAALSPARAIFHWTADAEI